MINICVIMKRTDYDTVEPIIAFESEEQAQSFLDQAMELEIEYLDWLAEYRSVAKEIPYDYEMYPHWARDKHDKAVRVQMGTPEPVSITIDGVTISRADAAHLSTTIIPFVG